MEQKIRALEINMAEIKTDIKYIKDSVKQNEKEHREIINKIDGFIKASEDRFAAKKEHRELTEQIASLDDKYAPKMAWTVLCWLGGIIGTAIVIGVVGVIVNAFIYMSK